MKLMDLPSYQRPREKMISLGAENLKDKELVAILLRTGREGQSVLDLASALLRKFGLKGLFEANYSNLRAHKGLDAAKICTLMAVFELTRRIIGLYQNHLPVIECPGDVEKMTHELKNLRKEHFMALYLNARKQLVYKETISVGTVDESLVHPREVLAPALEVRAANIILVHNHPSGVLTPSEADVITTKRLIKAGELLGIEILDHVVLSVNGWLSMKEKKYF